MAANGTWSAWTETTTNGYNIWSATFATLTGTDDTQSNSFSLDTTKLAWLSLHFAGSGPGLGDSITITMQYSLDSGSTWINVSTTYFTTGAIPDAAIAASYVIVPQNFDAPLYRFVLSETGALDGADDLSVRVHQNAS